MSSKYSRSFYWSTTGKERLPRYFRWIYDDVTGQYYAARWGKNPQYDWGQDAWPPEAEKVLRHWLDTGVDGFVIDAAHDYLHLGPEQEQATIDLWVFEGEEEFLPRLEEVFEEQNPNIDLQITEIPEDDYAVKIDTALAAGAPPDIGFVFDLRWIKAGSFLSLDQMVEDEGLELDNYENTTDIQIVLPRYGYRTYLAS